MSRSRPVALRLAAVALLAAALTGCTTEAPAPADPEAVAGGTAAPGWASVAAARPDESSAGGGAVGEDGSLVPAGAGGGAGSSDPAEGGDEPPF